MKLCPICGGDVGSLTVSGPTTGTVSPCGHAVNPLAIEQRETPIVVDADRQTITVPDAPLPDRLAAIQAQLNQRDVVTTADVQAMSDELQPVVSGLVDAVQPLLDAFNDAAKKLAAAVAAIDQAAAAGDDDEDDDRDSRLPERFQKARERRKAQRDRAEGELGDFRYP